jgi:hypothetical protein
MATSAGVKSGTAGHVVVLQFNHLCFVSLFKEKNKQNILVGWFGYCFTPTHRSILGVAGHIILILTKKNLHMIVLTTQIFCCVSASSGSSSTTA